MYFKYEIIILKINNTIYIIFIETIIKIDYNKFKFLPWNETTETSSE